VFIVALFAEAMPKKALQVPPTCQLELATRKAAAAQMKTAKAMIARSLQPY
jgi:hypothetical protein